MACKRKLILIEFHYQNYQTFTVYELIKYPSNQRTNENEKNIKSVHKTRSTPTDQSTLNNNR